MLRFKNQTNEENYASNELMWNILNNLVPIGSIIPFVGNVITSNMFKLCDGSVLNRIKYKVLFGVIGTTYGEGDGVSTFNLPNLTGRFLEGALEAGEYKEAGLPNITGSFSTKDNVIYPGTSSGAFLQDAYGSGVPYASLTGSSYLQRMNIDASRSSAIYGKSTTVQPKSITCKYIMRVC